ncbi:hypothetical protein QQ020_21340 [Fulvivirgaceae bacterium BMA12]|uniref:Lipoprotein n=1 Tax=Agaribacillus aureus TaxID=3051825 RepID=A0ABT8LEA9_9BACT|nr:hypothetical protein [Fulvivirgaceae bacterium BMA12]
MRKQFLVCALILLILLQACQEEEVVPSNDSMTNIVNEEEIGHLNHDRRRRGIVSRSRVYEMGTDAQIRNAYSRIIRKERGVMGEFRSPALNPSEVYTLWMIIFENPELCSDGQCGSDDIVDSDGKLMVNPDGSIGTPGVNVSSIWADGTISDPIGRVIFRIRVEKNQAPGEVLYGPGLTDPIGSEIHFVARTHGERLRDRINEQISTFAGGCDVNECQNQQYAIHLPGGRR